MSMSSSQVGFILLVVALMKLTSANNSTLSISVSPDNMRGLLWLTPPTRFFETGNAKLCAKLERLLLVSNEDEVGETGRFARHLPWMQFNTQAYVEKTEIFLRSMRSWRLTRVFYAASKQPNSDAATLWQWYDAFHKLLTITEKLYERYYFYYFLKYRSAGSVNTCSWRLQLDQQVIDRYINDTETNGFKLLYGLFVYEGSSIDILSRCNNSTSAELLKMVAIITNEYVKIQSIFTELLEALYGNYENRATLMRSVHTMMLSYKAMSSVVWGNQFNQLINSDAANIARCGVHHEDLRGTTSMMSRIALGRLSMILQHINVSLGQTFTETIDLMKNMSCLILSEDIDINLSRHVSHDEISTIRSMLQKDCAEISQSLNCTTQFMEKMKELWSRSRISLNQQFSAYTQYYNRMESILSIRASLRTLLPLLAGLGIPFNIILLLYHCKRTNYKLPHNMLVMALCIFDSTVLLVTLACLFMDRFMDFDSNLKPTIYSDLWCKVAPFLQYFSIECSAWTLLLISLERCSLILNVLKSRQSKLLDYRRILVMLLSVLLALVLINFTLMIADEITGPVRSTQGHHCVHYVRLKRASENITYLTVIRPWIIALVRFVCPFCGLLFFNFITCRYLFCKSTFSFSGCDDTVENEDENRATDNATLSLLIKRELRTSIRSAFVALAYLLLSCPAPILYFMYMIKHGDLIRLQIDNGLVALDDPNLRDHWHLIGHFTAGMYITDYFLIPLCSSINLLISCAVDNRLRGHLLDFMLCNPPRSFLTTGNSDNTSVANTDNLEVSQIGIMHGLQELQYRRNLIESEYDAVISINPASLDDKSDLKVSS